MTGNLPSLFGVIFRCVVMPGTASCFCPNCGTQNEWMTSRALRLSSVDLFSGSRSSVVVTSPPPGYLKVQANCCAVTSTVMWSAGMRSFLARATALTTPITTTRMVGTAVQAISRPVWP